MIPVSPREQQKSDLTLPLDAESHPKIKNSPGGEEQVEQLPGLLSAKVEHKLDKDGVSGLPRVDCE